jgi:hypothetical protein
VAFAGTDTGAATLRIEDAYSPRDAKRAQRPRTEYIVLHTTEAGDSSSLNSVQRYGSCHYLVMTDGLVKRIVHRDKIANHAGRSLWDGVRNLSTRSIGIEIVGTYKEPATEEQLTALKEVIDQLQSLYDIPDKNVLTHSQIAYSYHSGERRNVRGRRKDAVQFADPAVRALIGLTDRWTFDPDERAGTVGFLDYAEGRWLQKVLYAPPLEPAPELVAELVAKPVEAVRPRVIEAKFASLPPIPAPPPPKTPAKAVATEEPAEDPETFEGFRVLGVHGDTIEELAGDEALSETTIYFLPDGRLRSGDRLRGSPLLKRPPAGLKILIGYVIGGEVTAKTHALNIAGAAWNYPSTFYRLPNLSIVQGDKIDDAAIPPGTVVLYRH